MTKDKHDIKKILELRDEFRRRDTHVVAVTIARGGSRRLPRKNVLPVCGRPLVEWSILQSRCSHLITENYLSTDDEEIADIGRRAGAKVIWRYEKDAEGVTAGVTFVHAIRQIREAHPMDIILTILPTNPVRNPWDFDETVRLYWDVRKQDRHLGQLIVLAPQLETILHKRLDDRRSRVVLGDKANGYLDGAGGTWCVADPDWYVDYATRAPVTDREIDAKLVDVGRFACELAQADHYWYYPLEHYQRFDLDLPEQVGVIEACMQRYVLQEGTDVYERYRNQG